MRNQRKLLGLALAAALALGAALPAFAAAPPGKASGPTIFGTDDREVVGGTTSPPYSAVCKLYITYQNGTTGQGTGFLYGKNALATAGHVLYDFNYGRGGDIKSLTIVPGANGEQAPLGSRTVDAASAAFLVPASFRRNMDWRYDYGAVVLEEPFGEEVGALELGHYSAYGASALAAQTLSIVGYDTRSAYLYASSGLPHAVRGCDLLYRIDILPGQSGAPILAADGRVVGIQNYGANVGSAVQMQAMRYNSGARLTRAVYTFLQEAAAPSGEAG